MWLVHTLLLLSVLRIQEDFFASGGAGYTSVLGLLLTRSQPGSGNGLQCFSCVGSNDENCNRQGTEQCSRDSDACAIIRGQSGGVTKSCSYKSFCDRAVREGGKGSGVSVSCCFSNNCNSGIQASGIHLSASYIPILVALTFGFCILIVS